MTGIIILSIVTAIMVVLCAIILAGKGDHLIAGYNTASEEEKQYQTTQACCCNHVSVDDVGLLDSVIYR